MFDLDKSNVHRYIQYMEPVDKSCIPLPKLYNITRRLRALQEVELCFPGFKAFIDCTEQEIQRPKDKRKKKEKLLLWQEEKTYSKDTIYSQ